MTQTDYDLLIIGGGMVGASLACALAGLDLRIGLVEAAPFAASAHPGYDDRTIALAQGTKRIFQTLGLWETLGPTATPIRQIHISERGGLGFAHLDSREEGVDALGYVAEARAIGAALLAKLPGLSGVELLCPARLERVAIEPEAARADIRSSDGRTVELRARLLVAADGASSPVREQLGVKTLRWEYGQQAVIANVTPTLPHRHVAYERFTEDGPVALLPMSDNRCAVVCTAHDLDAPAVLALGDAGFAALLHRRFGDRLGKGVRTAPRDALIADSIQPGQRGLAFGLHRAGDTAGAVGGLLVALAVVWFTQRDSALLTRPAFQLLVLLSLIPAVLAVLVLAFGARETPLPPERRAAPRFSLKPFDARFRFFLVIVLVFTLGNSSDAFLILRAQAAGLPLVGVLGMMITFNVIYAALAGPAGAFSDRVDRRWLLIGGWLLYGLVYLGFAWVTEGWQAWALMAVYGVYYALTEGVAKAYVADLVPPALRGTAYGVYNGAVGLMAFPASFLAGVLWQGALGWDGFGAAAPFYSGAALALLAAGLLVSMPRAGSVTQGA